MDADRVKGTRYSLTLPPPLEAQLDQVSKELHISKSEALRRALVLFRHAVEADKVELTGKHGKQAVLIK